MKKKVLSGLLAIAMVFGSAATLPEGVFDTSAVITASAETSDDYSYKELADGTVEITKYSGNYTMIDIPSTLGGKQVTSIGSDAFSDRTYLEKIIIPSSVTNIAEKAFASAPALKKVTIPDSVKAIGDNAFNSKCTIICTKSSYAYVYAALYSIKCEYIAGDYIYKDIDDETVEITGYTGKDKTLNIPPTLAGKTVTSIGNSAFKAYISLTNVTIPNSVTSIGEDAFSHCRNIESVTIPSSVRRFGEFAFGDCDKLESAVIPTGVETISYALFAECRGLKSITLPSSVKSIENSAFGNCSALTSITIPGNVTYIGASAFEGCTGLKSLTIPSSVETIDDYAFGACGFTSLTVPKTVTKIGKMAIGYVHNEQHRLVKDNKFTVKCYKDTAAEKYAKENGLDYIIFDGDYLYKELDDGNVEITGYTGKASALSIPSTLGGKKVTKIGNSAFYDCKSLTNVTIPNSVTSIGVNAFRDCTSLTSITIPNSVTTICYYAFSGCTRLKSVTIPNSVTSIDTYAFAQCTSLTSITISNSVAKTGIGVFYNCLSLASVTIPSGVTVINSEAFKYCTGLTSITIPDSVTSIHSDAFAGCSSLKSITIPKSVTSIGSDAFTKCTSLNSLTIPKSVTKIYKRAFGYNNEEGEKNNDFVVKCYKGTAAETYAKDNGFKIEYIGLKHIAAKAATCTTDGNIEYWKHDGKFYSDAKLTTEITQAKTVVKATGHLWGTPNWTWTGTKAANASFVCQRDKSHTQSFDATITSNTTKPTCTKAGKTVYTATVKLNGKAYTDTKTVTLKATGHNYGTPTYEWSKDNKTVTATRVCLNDKNHKQIETVNVTAKTTNATCTKAGQTVYTSAAFKNTAFKVQTKNVTLKATGHKFSAWKTTSFNVDKKTATQTRKCARGDKTETKTITNAVVRYAGSDRAQTASLISNGMYKTADTVIIATGFDFHDALAAVPLASAYNAPLLLADRDNLSAKTIAEIKRLKAKNVIVVASTNAKDLNGNDAAIKSKVYAQLKELKVKITKLDGKTYYETAKKVADALGKKKAAPTSVFITTDKNYADALSASPVAAILGAPILYVDPKAALNSTTKNYLASIKKSVKNIYIVGGVNAVSKNVEKAVLSTLGKKSATRFAGDNRYETCVLINKSFAKNLTGKSVCIAKGYNFPDALAGGVFAAKQKAPLFLADALGGKAELSKTQSSYLKSKNPSKLYIFGGETAVPTALVKTVAKACV